MDMTGRVVVKAGLNCSRDCSSVSPTTIKEINLTTGNFRRVRETGMLYVDKTKQIFDSFLNTGDRYHFIARPRRFGKSLLCSTISELFSGDEKLFCDLAITEESWDFREETRPVIYLDMSHLGANANDILSALAVQLNWVAGDLGLQELISDEKFRHSSAAAKLIRLVATLHRKHGKSVVVIIDEYDAPLSAILNKPGDQQQMVETLRNFYGVLKGLDQHLRLVYLTGILKFSDTNVFSTLNNILLDHTHTVGAATVCGFTEEEIVNNHAAHLNKFVSKMEFESTEAAIRSLREDFDGYCFALVPPIASESLHRVYNPYAINHALSCKHSLGVYKSKWSETGHAKALTDLLLRSNSTGSALDERSVPYSVFLRMSPDQLTSEALMLYAGYSTIRSYDPETDMVTVAPPNKCVTEDLLFNITNSLLFEYQDPTSWQQQLARKLVKAMFSASKKDVVVHLNPIIALMPHQMLRSIKTAKGVSMGNGREATLSVLLSVWLTFGCRGDNEYVVEEVPWRRGDIGTVMINSQLKTVCAAEFKVGQTAEEALGQIREKNFRARYPGREVILFGVNITEGRMVEVAIEVLAARLG
jgi:hypothetical protein